jgi:hypothetical protein
LVYSAGVRRGSMSRVKYTTTIDEELLNKAKTAAATEGHDGANAIIEKALRMYFANCSTEVWEKPLNGGWLKKLIIRSDKVVFESIRIRKQLRYSPKYYTDKALEVKGWKKVWKVRSAG